MNDSSREDESNYQIDDNYNEIDEEQKDAVITKYPIAGKALEPPIRIEDIMSKLNTMENTMSMLTTIQNDNQQMKQEIHQLRDEIQQLKYENQQFKYEIFKSNIIIFKFKRNILLKTKYLMKRTENKKPEKWKIIQLLVVMQIII